MSLRSFMVFNGRTTGPSYTTTLLPDDTLIKLTGIAQSSLGVKLVRSQTLRRVGIDGIKLVESGDIIPRNQATYNRVWSEIFEYMRNNPADKEPIMTITEQRAWYNREKERDIITSLSNIPDDVFHYKRDLFARWYDVQYFNVDERFREGLSYVPRFREVKIYYNCDLNREEYIKAGHITGLTYNSPPPSPSVHPFDVLRMDTGSSAARAHNCITTSFGRSNRLILIAVEPAMMIYHDSRNCPMSILK
jgi:hypothetical protein